MKKEVNWPAISLGIFSVAAIIGGIITCLTRAQSAKPINEASIIFFFIVGVSFGTVAIVLTKYHRKRLSEEANQEDR